jgi:uncharacterized protein (DUF2236 family)
MEPRPLPADDEALLALAGLDVLAAPADGLFREDGWLRRVSREPVLLFGGGRALLLEVAHPLVAAGVAEHSAFRQDPFGRLQRTLAAMSALTFGTRDEALEAARSVERAHRRVRGTLPEAVGPFAAGTPYSGRDPELVRWVWATLVDTALAVYRDFVGPLSAEAVQDHYRDQCVIARLLGVPPEILPPDAPAFRAWFDAALEGDVLCVGSAGREIAEAVLDAPAATGGPVRTITAALLPPRLRDAFGLRWSPERAARYRGLADAVRGLRRGPVDASREAR